MSLLAVIAWIITAGGGLYLLSIWLIEYDREFHAEAATRLPPAVLAGHVMLAGGGLLVWIGYLILDSGRLAWTAVVVLGLAATPGLVMAVAGSACSKASGQPSGPTYRACRRSRPA